MLNNKFCIVARFECGNCALQKDEEMLIQEVFMDLSKSLNSRGIEMMDMEINKYGN